MSEKKCIWEWDEWADYYHTSCGSDFCFSDDEGLRDVKFKYCPYCGKEILEELNG